MAFIRPLISPLIQPLVTDLVNPSDGAGGELTSPGISFPTEYLQKLFYEEPALRDDGVSIIDTATPNCSVD